MLEKRTLDGYECRTEAMFIIADALGYKYEIGEKDKRLDKIYRDLSLVFKDKDTLPIGTGKTGRLRQAPFNKLFDFAKKHYNVEVDKWKVTDESSETIHEQKDDTMIIIQQFLNKLDDGTMTQSEFIGAIRGIVALHNMNKKGVN